MLWATCSCGVCLEYVERRAVVRRVVPEAVRIGDCGRELFGQGRRLHHLQADPPEREFAGDLANQPAVPGTGAEQHEVGLIRVAVIVLHLAGADVTHLATFDEPVVAGLLKLFPELLKHLTRLDDRIPSAPERAQKIALERRITAPSLLFVEQLKLPLGGILPTRCLLRDRQLRVGPTNRQRPARPKPDIRHLGPQLPGPLRSRDLRPIGPPTHPNKPEVPHTSPATPRLPLDLHHLMPTLYPLPSVKRPQHPATHHNNPHSPPPSPRPQTLVRTNYANPAPTCPPDEPHKNSTPRGRELHSPPNHHTGRPPPSTALLPRTAPPRPPLSLTRRHATPPARRNPALPARRHPAHPAFPNPQAGSNARPAHRRTGHPSAAITARHRPARPHGATPRFAFPNPQARSDARPAHRRTDSPRPSPSLTRRQEATPARLLREC